MRRAMSSGDSSANATLPSIFMTFVTKSLPSQMWIGEGPEKGGLKEEGGMRKESSVAE
jgi:hypothetical protein